MIYNHTFNVTTASLLLGVIILGGHLVNRMQSTTIPKTTADLVPVVAGNEPQQQTENTAAESNPIILIPDTNNQILCARYKGGRRCFGDDFLPCVQKDESGFCTVRLNINEVHTLPAR